MKTIGEHISTLRREKGMTQEELGRAVGVSMQAVSKWENGGVPDATLLPAIAETLNVSIDQLFGRNSAAGDVEQAIGREISALPREEQGRRMVEIAWALQRANFGSVRPEDGLDRYAGGECFSQIENEDCVSMFYIGSELDYAFLIRHPGCGFDRRLLEPEAQTRLFALLGQRDAFDLLTFLYTRGAEPFTAKFMEKRTGIPLERVQTLMKTFIEYELACAKSLDLDDERIQVYESLPNIALLPLLAASLQLIRRPKGFSFQSNYRENNPYFREAGAPARPKAPGQSAKAD